MGEPRLPVSSNASAYFSMRWVRAPAGMSYRSAMKFRNEMPDMNSYRSGLSGRNAVTRLAATGSRRTSWPSMRIVPSVKSSTPAHARSVVDFPAPLWPMKPTISPGSTCRFRSSTAFFPPE